MSNQLTQEMLDRTAEHIRIQHGLPTTMYVSPHLFRRLQVWNRYLRMHQAWRCRHPVSAWLKDLMEAIRNRYRRAAGRLVRRFHKPEPDDGYRQG